MGELIAANHDGDQAGNLGNRSREKVLQGSEPGVEGRSALRKCERREKNGEDERE